MKKSLSFFVMLSFFIMSRLTGADIAVVTMAIGDNYQGLVASGIENNRHYCEKHGYDFIYLTDNLDPSRPIAWNKILILQETLKNNEYKWVFWIDADAIFMNFGISIEELIDDHFDLLVGSDLVGCNTGNFLLKNTPWTKDFLKRVYSHEEFIYHRYWEQAAVMQELKTNEDVRKHTKIFAPRIINSYPYSLHGSQEVYRPGDFIIHFATWNGPILVDLMKEYTSLVSNDPQALNLDTYLDIHGLTLKPHHNPSVNEGCLTDTQKEQYSDQLKKNDQIKKIAVIGFNAGHSTEIFFQNCANCQIVACDSGLNSFTQLGVDFMKRKCRERFKFFEGDAEVMCHQIDANKKYDLIYINGDKSYQNRLKDILDCKKIATQKTILWVNDYAGEIERAVNDAVKQGVIVIDQKLEDSDPCGGRSWIIGHYL